MVDFGQQSTKVNCGLGTGVLHGLMGSGHGLSETHGLDGLQNLPEQMTTTSQRPNIDKWIKSQ